MSNDLAPQRRESALVIDPIPTFDTGRFEHMQRIATVMARSALIPESLYLVGTKDKKEVLPQETVMANCFLVVNQAVRWGLDPFAVAQCVSVVHGRLCYEGKLVAAVLEAKMGLKLRQHFVGKPGHDDFRIYLSDQDFSDEVIKALTPGVRLPGTRLVDGSVGEWKTTGSNSPWGAAKNHIRMLIYRGTREWCRFYEPALMLGVYTEDEMADLADDARARRATPVTSLADRLNKAPPTGALVSGFSIAHVDRETDLEADHETASTSAETAPPAEDATTEEFPGDSEQEHAEETSPVSPGEQEARSGQPAPQPGLSSDTITAYSQALARATQKASLTTLHKAFSEKLETPPNEAEVEIMREVFSLHLRRTKGEITAEDVTLQVREIAGA
ncbi:hypothetical protein [Xanthobacter tagetidis]|uniref:Recombinase RecT n=1 Tax=Xanthobacter tagetidis TaxID=60216 RepID=A0A3L7AGF1_9HYPH|nr:hypothetical protein [Xanthobacter tagetidis]MBB6306271.1 hypothetical protein [Xanthobacter tagetidis]RLP79546.1 hypothetical protein D9R14_07740 [Xanthobacter tagetidis]